MDHDARMRGDQHGLPSFLKRWLFVRLFAGCVRAWQRDDLRQTVLSANGIHPLDTGLADRLAFTADDKRGHPIRVERKVATAADAAAYGKYSSHRSSFHLD